VCQCAAVLDRDAAPYGGFVVRHVADRMPDRGERERHRHFADGAGCQPKISEIQNCVAWVTIKLFLQTPVWWWHEAKSPDPPLDRS
jgi:hypothetical protein